jgi:ornithine--oxo-acid transaminase
VVIECIRGHLRTFEQEIQFSANLYDLCKTHNILFIADEVRMGCGKTGRFLSCDYLGGSRRPDLLVLGKSISGGLYPAAFVLGRAECMDLVGTKEILSTYTFSPVALAATRAALKVIDDEGLVERARRIEKLFLEETGAWKHPIISHVTARGADFGIWLCGVEQRTCRQICEWCMHQGLLVFPNYLRIRMNVAMVITDEELLAGLQILKSVLDRTSRAE